MFNRSAMLAIWQGLKGGWRKIQDEMAPEDPPHWSKSCDVLTVFVYKDGEPNTFAVEFLSKDDQVVYTQKLRSSNVQTALCEADDVIDEVVRSGFTALTGKYIGNEDAREEIRFSNIAINGDMVIGISLDGVAYQKVGASWKRMPMVISG